MDLLQIGTLAWWRRSVVVSAMASINVVNRHWARLVLGWVTACGRVNHLGM